MSLLEYMLLAPISLFVIINPFSTVPAFLAITPTNTATERIWTARMGCLIAAVIMAFFAVAVQFIINGVGQLPFVLQR